MYPRSPDTRRTAFFARPWTVAGVIFALSFAVHVLVSWERTLHASANNHFAYLAQSWLHGRLDLGHSPPHGNDWAQVTTLTLTSGEVLRGSYWRSRGKYTFRTTAGRFVQVLPTHISKSTQKWYVSFPPMPALLMTPLVAIWGTATNDVLFTIFFASLNGALFWLLLLKLRKNRFHNRDDAEMLSLVALLIFGSVHFFSAVRGEVWFTAHIVGLTFALLYMLALFNHRFVLAGAALGAAFLSRTPYLFAALLVPFVVYRKTKTFSLKPNWAPLTRFALPFGGLLIAAMVLNWLRFDDPFEFGHHYLNIRWRLRIERYGLFSYEYLSRNLAVAFTLLPRFRSSYPFILISPHGMALWITMPLLFTLVRFRGSHPLLKPLLLVGISMFTLVLLYQNSGFVQFGYRFSIDFLPFFVLLLAFSKLRFGRVYYALLTYSILINLFGAITFGRHRAFYPPGSFIFFTT